MNELTDSNNLDPAAAVIVNLLNELAPNATVPWGQAHEIVGDAVPGWVDVMIRFADGAPMWAFTVDEPSNASTDMSDTFLEVVPDRAVCGVWNPAGLEWDHQVAAPVGTALTDPALADVVEAAGSRDRVGIRPGWTFAAISAALADWTRVHAGRTDLVWSHDPSIGADYVDGLCGLAAAVDSGEVETFDLGDGLRVAAPAFDLLVAAEIDGVDVTAQIKDTFGLRDAS